MSIERELMKSFDSLALLCLKRTTRLKLFLAALKDPDGAEKITKAVYRHTQLAFHASVASQYCF